MIEQEIPAAFLPLYSPFINIVEFMKKPLLAHYTSLISIEKIVKGNELWFSNPLFMNDLHEVRFGMLEGIRIFAEEFSEETFIKSVWQSRVNVIREAFFAYYREFDERHALDVYVFCLSQHDPDDRDGLL